MRSLAVNHSGCASVVPVINFHLTQSAAARRDKGDATSVCVRYMWPFLYIHTEHCEKLANTWFVFLFFCSFSIIVFRVCSLYHCRSGQYMFFILFFSKRIARLTVCKRLHLKWLGNHSKSCLSWHFF